MNRTCFRESHIHMTLGSVNSIGEFHFSLINHTIEIVIVHDTKHTDSSIVDVLTSRGHGK